jgi:uncharacterized protein YdbL (DUF1318 family)
MYKKIIFLAAFLLNIALYLPSAQSVSFSCLDDTKQQLDLAGQILKQADVAYISKLSEEAAAENMLKIFNKARDAKIAELALEKGLSINEYADIYKGINPSSVFEQNLSLVETASTLNNLKEMVNKDLYRANFGLDQTMTTEAFNQYATSISNILKMNKTQYVKMYKEAVTETLKQVKEYYTKFPYPTVTACS